MDSINHLREWAGGVLSSSRMIGAIGAFILLFTWIIYSFVLSNKPLISPGYTTGSKEAGDEVEEQDSPVMEISQVLTIQCHIHPMLSEIILYNNQP